MKTKVKVHIITFINGLDKEDTFSVVGDEDIEAKDFCGEIFGHDFDVTGLHKAITYLKNLGVGHQVLKTEHEIEINY
jgi:hypothetical protein